MDDGRKDLVYGELAEGKLPVGGPKLCKGVCKRNMKSTGLDAGRWEALVSDKETWGERRSEKHFQLENSTSHWQGRSK